MTAARSSVLERCTEILDAFFDGPARLSLNEVVEQTGLPRSTTFRLLTHLVSLGWLQRDQYGYGIGSKIIDAGSRIAGNGHLRQSAYSILNELHQTTGGFAHLGVLEQSGWVYYLDRVGRSDLHPFASEVGVRRPLEKTAIGKSILAAMSSETANRVISRRELETGVKLDALRNEVQHWRRLGAVARVNASVNGSFVNSIAAPIFGPSGPIAAIAVGGEGLQEERLGAMVLGAANSVGRRMYASLSIRSETPPVPDIKYFSPVGTNGASLL